LSRGHSFVAELSATLIRLLAYVGGVVVLTLLAAKLFGMPAVNAAVERDPWSAVEKPFHAFTLTIPEFAEPEPDYAIRRHPGGGRKDILSWGGPWLGSTDARSRLHVEIYRPGKEIRRFDDAASAVAARTAELGGPFALKPAAPIESKLGQVATFDFTAALGRERRRCLGFVRAFDEPMLEISGWYCKGGNEMVDRGTLACALEQLTLVMAASEPKVTELFAHIEMQRKACGQRTGPRTASPRTSSWIDAPAKPKLRGRFITR
jgi:hypothetical protein